MKEKKNIFVVIPAFNEEGSIASVVAGAKKHSKVIVVDDGSDDDTASIAERSGAFVLRHVVNRGVGAATWTGVLYALRDGADVVVTLDGDCQHDPADIVDVAKPVIEGDADVVIGSRFKGKHWTMPWKKRIGNFILNQITYWLYRIEGTDTQSGFRAYSRLAIKKIRITVDGYGYCSEVVGEIAKHSLRLEEIPIATVYIDKFKGTRTWDGIEILADLVLKRLA